MSAEAALRQTLKDSSPEVRIAAAEALHTQLNLWGVIQPPIAKQVALAYEQILLYGEHTWGGAASVNQYGEAFAKLDPKKYASLEASWEDKTDYIRDIETFYMAGEGRRLYGRTTTSSVPNKWAMTVREPLAPIEHGFTHYHLTLHPQPVTVRRWPVRA